MDLRKFSLYFWMILLILIYVFYDRFSLLVKIISNIIWIAGILLIIYSFRRNVLSRQNLTVKEKLKIVEDSGVIGFASKFVYFGSIIFVVFFGVYALASSHPDKWDVFLGTTIVAVVASGLVWLGNNIGRKSKR